MAKDLSQHDRFFLMMFASQQQPTNWPNTTHSFCALVKASGADRQPIAYETLVYSWLPAKLDNWIEERLPEPGRNYGLDDTIRWALNTVKADVFAWKPLVITPTFYELASIRVKFLNSGRLKYTLIDNLFWRPKKVSNCIHAVSDTLAPQFPKLLTGFRHGIAASQYVLDYFTKYNMIHGTASAYEVEEVKTFLDLAEYPITYRSYHVESRANLILDETQAKPRPLKGSRTPHR